MIPFEINESRFSLAEMEAAIEQAHVERARAMREMLVAFYRGVKHLAGSLHIHHGHVLPHAKVSA